MSMCTLQPPPRLVRPLLFGALAVVLLARPGSSTAAHVAWLPAAPCIQDEVRIVVDYAAQGGTLHWGINAEGRRWERPLPTHQPAESESWNGATRTPLSGPDDNGRYEVVLGPFPDPDQIVRSIHFVIQWDDGSWENRAGQDYRIDLCSRRVTFAPDRPTFPDAVRVRVAGAGEGAVLHWGVNERLPGRWSRADEVYWPAGTSPRGAGNAVETPLPPAGDDGVTELVLGPFNRAEQVVTSLHAVVRWNNQWDTDAGRNFNIALQPVVAADARLALEGLVPGETVHDDVTLNVRRMGEAAERAPVEISLNQQPFATLAAGETQVVLPVAGLAFGAHQLVAASEVEGRTERAHMDFLYYPQVDRQRAPVGIRLGANETRTGLVRFALHAPGKYAVSLIGDFNDWQPQATPMKLSPDGIWWCEMDLPQGRHRYQYLIDGHLNVGDPYARDVEWKDEQGRETWRPERAFAVMDVGAAPFDWGLHAYVRPALEDLIIYELYIEDFVPGGGFLGLIEKLDYIQSLGVNAIEMLPITEFGTTHSWGYNPSFPFAPESTYGTPHDLKRLIDEAHRRGLAVIFDIVLNHLDSASPFYRLYGDDYNANPYFYLDEEKDNWGFPALDQESPAVKRLAADIIDFWLRQYRFDGFRYDATRWVGWSGEKDWGAGWFAYAGKMADPDSYHIAEHIPPDPELMIQTHMDSNWDSEFRWRIRDMLTQGRLDGDAFARVVDPARSGYERPTHRMIYIESHDEERVLRDLRLAGYEEEEALRRVKTAHALLLTSPGLIMLFSGEEWGEATQKVVGLNPLHWENLEQPHYRSIRDNLVNLISLRRDHPVLTRGAVDFVALDDAEGVAVFRRSHEESVVLVAVNFSRASRSVEIPLQSHLNWRLVAGDPVDESLLQAGGWVDLPAGGALVLRGEPRGR